MILAEYRCVFILEKSKKKYIEIKKYIFVNLFKYLTIKITRNMKKIIDLFAIVSLGFVACNNAAETTEGTEENVENAEAEAESLLDQAEEATEEATEAVEETTEEAVEAVEETTEEATEAVEEAVSH